MLAGAWGERAGKLLERASERYSVKVYRVEELTMLTAPDVVAGSWYCWLFGEPESRIDQAGGVDLHANDSLPMTFGRALQQLGAEACAQLCGRFAIVTFDRERGRCLVMRDQLGAQPLVYTRVSDGALFAEHARDLLELLPRTPSPDRLSLLHWVGKGTTPRERTLYEGLQRLPAGHRLILEGTQTGVERWWSVEYQEAEGGSASMLGERLRDATFAAVGRAAAGSAHPAVKLSGGLDSSSVAAGLSASGFADGRATAIGGTFAAYPVSDERELIEATAHHAHLPLELVAFNANNSMLTPALEHIVRWRLPPATPNLFLWQPLLARARALGVDLMLDGEGGDELFGLAPYLIADRLRAGRVIGAWSLSGRLPGMWQHPGGRVRMRVLRRYGLAPLVPNAVQQRRERARIAASRSIVPLADELALFELDIASREDPGEGPLWWRFQAKSLIDERDTIDMASHFRREAADAAINVRHPLLHDLQLIETALQLPPQAQFDPIRDRPLMRDGLKGLVPETVRTRHEKSHFTPLVLAGLETEESSLVEPLRRPDAPLRAYVAADALDRRLAVTSDARSMLAAGPLWHLAIANRWLSFQADGD